MVKYARPTDLHDRFYRCEHDGCVQVVLEAEHRALAARLAESEELYRDRARRHDADKARLAEAERVLRRVAEMGGTARYDFVHAFLRASDNGGSVPISQIVRSVAEQYGYTPVDTSELEKTEITGVAASETAPPAETVTHTRAEQSSVPFTIALDHQNTLYHVMVALHLNVEQVCLRVQRQGDYVTLQWLPMQYRTADSASDVSPTVTATREMHDVTMGGLWGPASTKREYTPGRWRYECSKHGVIDSPECPQCKTPCPHRGLPDWISVPKPAVSSATRFCPDCGQYIRPPSPSEQPAPLPTEEDPEIRKFFKLCDKP